MLCAAPASQAADGGFLFVTFKGEATPMSEQISFGPSHDGCQRSTLNGGGPVLVSTHAGYQPFVRRDLARGRFVPAPDIQSPFLFRRGPVLPVTGNEYMRLGAADKKP